MIENEKNLLADFDKFEREPLSKETIDTLLYCFNKSIGITFKANAVYHMTNGDYRAILEKVMFSALTKYFELLDEKSLETQTQEKS